MEEINDLTHDIIAAAIEVHRILGPGLLEEFYKQALAHELVLRGFKVEKEVAITCKYKDIILPISYKAEIIVEDKVIVELKATEKDNPMFAKQLYTYLKVANKRVGLLMNFNRMKLTDGLERVINSSTINS